MGAFGDIIKNWASGEPLAVLETKVSFDLANVAATIGIILIAAVIIILIIRLSKGNQTVKTS